MTTEQEAKAYEIALEAARKELGVDRKEWEVVQRVLHNIFPELRESEDEIIRNRLINLIRELASASVPIMTGGYFIDGQDKRYIAYLEKQKEQKHPDGCFTCDEYKKGYEDGRRNGFTAGYNKAIKEVEQKEHKPEHFELKAGKWYICHRAFCCRADHLTVKEGERFMCEKDGVVKGFIIKEPEKYFIECSAPAPMEDEQKEPHYTKRNALFDKCVENCDPEVMKEVSDKVDEMLGKEQKPDDDPLDDPKFLKGFDTGREVQRIFDEQKPAEWSEEDKCMYDSIMCEVVNEGMNLTPAQVNWIKLLPERFVLQPKQEWSEEDEKKLEDLTSLLAILEGCSTVNVGTAAKYNGWLKSFRSRPKSSDNWKPSEKQINALQDSIDLDKTVLRRGRLIGLLEDLKRLM